MRPPGCARKMDPEFGQTTQTRNLALGVVPNVLLVDDDELVLASLAASVRAAGFEVRTACGGLEALASLKQVFTPVVITDLNMPGMDGLELCRKIRQHPWPGYIYLLLLTAQDAEQDILAGLNAGADDYLSKRTSPAQLLARLRTAQRLLTLEQSLKGALTQTRRLAMTDALTGAPNRLYFQERLGRELGRLRRFGGDLCLMSLDLDNFKQINDRDGHTSGDAVLQEFVRRLDRCLPRDTDWYARIGGEEFAVILDGTALPGAAVVAERVRQAIAVTPIKTPAALVNLTVSIGVSGLSTLDHRADCTIESLLQLADRNLYFSKHSGRNRVTLPGPVAAIEAPELTVQGNKR
jgi:two-component system cell cycle response regulator